MIRLLVGQHHGSSIDGQAKRGLNFPDSGRVDTRGQNETDVLDDHRIVDGGSEKCIDPVVDYNAADVELLGA
jgi:hypothetical protein